MKVEAPKIGGGIGLGGNLGGSRVFSVGRPSIGEVGLKGGLRTSLDLGPKLQSPTGNFFADRTVPRPGNVFREGFFETLAKPEKLSTGQSVAKIQPDRRINLPKKPISVFDFGPEHKVNPESLVADRVPSQAASIFKEGIFGTLAKPKQPEVTVSEGRTEIDSKPSGEIFSASGSEVFVPKPEKVKPTVTDRPVPEKDFPYTVVEENIVVDVGLSVKTQKEDDQEKERKDKKQKKDRSVGLDAIQEEQTLWQILTGEIISPPKTAVQLITKEEGAEEENRTEAELQPVAQFASTSVNDQNGEIIVSIGQNRSKEPEEPKEPLWEVSGRKPASEEVAGDVLKRRIDVAQGVVETAAKEVSQKERKDRHWFLARVINNLGQIDIPTEEEFLRMIFGRLTFPLVTKEGEEKIKSLKPVELHPGGVFKTLQKILITKPPVKPKGGEMEYDGSLPQSRLEQLNNEAKVLAQGGAQHIVYDPRIGKMKKVEEKQYRYPLELDKTVKTVPVESAEPKSRVIDRRETPWYTLFAQRAEARAKRKAKS